MPYDSDLAARVRKALGGKRKQAVEKEMFGGLAFLLGGHMCCGVVQKELMLRLEASDAEKALSEPHTRPMDFTGTPLKGFVFVTPEGIEDDAELKRWVTRAASFVSSLPPKA